MAGFGIFCEIKMRLIFAVLVLMVGFAYSQNQPDSYETESFRRIQDKNFRDRQTSPLLPEDFEKFDGLKYFAFDANYRVKAIFKKTDDSKTFTMPTSTGGSRKYLKIGDLDFKLNGKDYSLSAFSSGIPDLFVPFKDLTNGEETYSAGRYVYVRLPKQSGEVILDFNIAYNPNCAYNSGYACTLPPKENFLQIEIKAGEKKFKF